MTFFPTVCTSVPKDNLLVSIVNNCKIINLYNPLNYCTHLNLKLSGCFACQPNMRKCPFLFLTFQKSPGFKCHS